MTYVWYACYGSNINRERFMRYINNCTDRTEPVEDRPYEFAHPVFFAGASSIWGGKGKVFLDDTADGHAFGRIYKITDEQYSDAKENHGTLGQAMEKYPVILAGFAFYYAVSGIRSRKGSGLSYEGGYT